MEKVKLADAVTKGSKARKQIDPELIIGVKNNGYTPGDIFDANAVIDAQGDCYEKKSNIIIEEDGIYQVKDNSIYPVAHPDISTQPSILPQRFGNLEIKEVLIANGRENEIPAGAMVIEASSFNAKMCVPAICEKDKIVRVRVLENVETDIVKGVTLIDNLNKHIVIKDTYKSNDLIKIKSDNMIYSVIFYDNMSFHVLSDSYDGWQGSYSFVSNTLRMKFDNDSGQFHSVLIDDITYDDKSIFDEKVEIKKGWSIRNDHDMIPDFTLVRYVDGDKGCYYYTQNDGSEIPLPTPVNFEFPIKFSDLVGKSFTLPENIDEGKFRLKNSAGNDIFYFAFEYLCNSEEGEDVLKYSKDNNTITFANSLESNKYINVEVIGFKYVG